MRTIQVNLYQFDELSDEAQENARDWWREIGLDYEWWDAIYEDAECINCSIDGFSLDRSQECSLRLKGTVRNTAHLILNSHGQECDTYKLVAEYYRRKRLKVPINPEEFRQQLSECYLQMLNREYEYILSDEHIDECLRINEYEFTEYGRPL